MFDILIHDIPRLMFEPVFFFTLIGLILFIYFNFSQKKHDVILVLLIIGFMLGSRMMCHAIMVSKRYSLALLYPGILLAAYGFWKSDAIFRWLRIRHSISIKTHKIYSLLPSILFIILCVSCFQYLDILIVDGKVRVIIVIQVQNLISQILIVKNV